MDPQPRQPLSNLLPLPILTLLTFLPLLLDTTPTTTLLLALPTSLLLLLALPYLQTPSLTPLTRRHIWLLGASRGIGAATVRQLASLNATITISSRDPHTLHALREQLVHTSATIHVLPVDVTSDWDTLRHAWMEANATTPVDILIANAGINHSSLSFSHLTDDTIDDVLTTNLTSVLRLFRIALPHLRARKGTLAVVSSQAAYRGLPGASVYGATKAAVTSLVQSLRIENAGTGLHVVAIHPGFVDTDAIRGLHHPKFGMVDADEAARQILVAIVGQTGHWGFPAVMEEVVMRAARWLPEAIYEAVLTRVAKKMREESEVDSNVVAETR